jgi:outer membrane biosynthesis protein TonB
MQLRLVAGPFDDAAEAAKTCAILTTANRPCETTVFDGQRLALKVEPAAAATAATPAPAKPAPRKRAAPKHQEQTEQVPPPKPAEEPAPPPKPPSPLSSLLGIR